ncbi:MAG: hypothetical protein SH850_11880 [Planctomycetaceae bacterium]|nr:hypothetical protein [Planctomycetaceae bacterium]
MPRTYKAKTDRKNTASKPQAVPKTFHAGFLVQLDGRTEIAKALRANFDEIVRDMGGEADLSHVKRSLVERFVWLEAILQGIEHDLATGKVDRTAAIGSWIQAVNSLSGLSKVIGTERKASAKPWLDATAVEQA